MRVVGLGRDERGDDGIGLAVCRRLRERGVACQPLPDTTQLVELLDGTPCIVIDAVLADPPGQLVELRVDELAGASAVSTHAMSLPEAIGLAEVLHGPTPVRILGITIAPPGPEPGLSPAVQAALEPAVARVQAWLDA